MLEPLIEIFQGFILIKIGFLILNAMYIAFLYVVYQQSKSMQAIINDNGASSLINTVALFNLIVGISLFVAALIIL